MKVTPHLRLCTNVKDFYGQLILGVDQGMPRLFLPGSDNGRIFATELSHENTRVTGSPSFFYPLVGAEIEIVTSALMMEFNASPSVGDLMLHQDATLIFAIASNQSFVWVDLDTGDKLATELDGLIVRHWRIRQPALGQDFQLIYDSTCSPSSEDN